MQPDRESTDQPGAAPPARAPEALPSDAHADAPEAGSFTTPPDSAAQPTAPPAPGSGRTAPVDVLLAVGLLIVLTMVLGLLVMRARRRLLARHEAHDQLSLMESLRRMRDRGDMSVEEFERARKALIDRAARRPAPAAGDRPPNPPRT